MSLPSIYGIYYVYTRLIFILAYLTIFITMPKKMLLVENFANLQFQYDLLLEVYLWKPINQLDKLNNITLSYDKYTKLL